MLRSTCKALRIHPPTPKYISILLTILSGKVHPPISSSEPYYFRQIFCRLHRACILHSQRKLVHFLPRIVKLACAGSRSRARVFDCPPNGCYVNNRRQFEDWLEAKHEEEGVDMVTIAGSFALKMAESELGLEVSRDSHSWQPHDIDVFIHGANEGEEHAVCDSVSAFCSQIQKECFLVLHNHSRIEVRIRHDHSYSSTPFHQQQYQHQPPYMYEEDEDATTVNLSPDSIVRSHIEYKNPDATANPIQNGHSYASSHLKRCNRGRVLECMDSVLDQLEDNGWLDANKELGIPRRYTISKAIAVDAFSSPTQKVSSSFSATLKLPSINIIQFTGPPRSSLDIVSGFDILPCQVWLTSDEASSFGLKLNYASDKVKQCIQNRKLALSKYAFNPCYKDDLPASLFIGDDERNDSWYNPISKQVTRILKYTKRGYKLCETE